MINYCQGQSEKALNEFKKFSNQSSNYNLEDIIAEVKFIKY